VLSAELAGPGALAVALGPAASERLTGADQVNRSDYLPFLRSFNAKA